MDLPSFLRRTPETLKTVVVSFKSEADLNNQISNLHAKEIVDIIPYKYEIRDMRETQILTSVLIVINN